MTDTDASSPAPSYRIGAVSRLTGIAPDTLRVWERRYRTVIPTRTEKGSRLYSQDDIGRLVLIKRLVDSGDTISRVANLSKAELHSRASHSPAQETRTTSGQNCRIAVLGTKLPEQLAGAAPVDDELEVVGLYRDTEGFLTRVPGSGADVIVLEYATIQPDQIREIHSLLMRSKASRALVIYGFASRTTLQRLQSARIIAVRGPLGRSEIGRWCLLLSAGSAHQPGLPSDCGIDTSSPPPSRRFDDATLAKIAAAPAAVRCECPKHLVDIISNLNDFEAYSEECEVLNSDDAALHALLHCATAQARLLLETVLSRVIEENGVVV